MLEREPANDRFAQRLRGFGPLGIAVFLVILLAGPAWFRALLVLGWAKLSATPLREIGYTRPKSWFAILGIGVVLGVAFKFLMKAVVMPLLGADPINYAYHFLVGNTSALPAIVLTIIVSAGFGEETVFRGYLFERLRKLLGPGKIATIAIILVTTGLFAGAHYWDQGIPGVQQALFTGALFGTIFAITGKIWLPMVAHAAFDLTAVAMIYWNVESEIAHLLFK